MASSSRSPMHYWTHGGTATQHRQVSGCGSTRRCMAARSNTRPEACCAPKMVPGLLPSHHFRQRSGFLLTGARARTTSSPTRKACKLQTALKLAPASKGENVVVTVPKDLGLLADAVEPAPGAVCTSPVQTYLDLSIAGERGAEAADHLRQERLSWPQ